MARWGLLLSGSQWRHLYQSSTERTEKALSIEGISIPNSKPAREITELVRDTETPLLFHHSSRVFYWGALTGTRRGLKFDPELLYAGAMFHDMGLTPQYRTNERFEVDSANAARDFLSSGGISQQDLDTVWTAIALTPHRVFRRTCIR